MICIGQSAKVTMIPNLRTNKGREPKQQIHTAGTENVKNNHYLFAKFCFHIHDHMGMKLGKN